MATDSKIQWTDHTWNPWHGCKKVSPGCKYCYMYRDKERYNQDPTTVLRSKSNFNQPLKWNEEGLVFTCSWSDFFIEAADEWRDEAWQIIKQTPHLTYQILTKRPERIKGCLPDDWGEGYPNVWLGVSIESQDMTKRIPTLMLVPAKVRFLSIEPLIGPVSITNKSINNGYSVPTRIFDGMGAEYTDPGPAFVGVDWVIIGGESGNVSGKYKFRRCDEDWIRDIIDECQASIVPVFVKQLGTSIARLWGTVDRHGGDVEEWPEYLQIREFPTV